MEDFITTSSKLNFFAVFDGHGGTFVAKSCSEKSEKYFEHFLAEGNSIQDSLKLTF